MNHLSNRLDNFVHILYLLKNQNFNPFEIDEHKKKRNTDRFSYPFGLYEDSLDFEVRCPICLGRVHIASKPLYCNHIFCFPCINKWCTLSKKCPVCRRDICSISKIDLKEISVSSQMDLYAKYDVKDDDK